jgi:hypothetical protein
MFYITVNCQYILSKKKNLFPHIYLYINVFFTFYFSTSSFYQLCIFFFYYSVVMERKGFKFGLFTVLVIVILTKMGFDTWSFAV